LPVGPRSTRKAFATCVMHCPTTSARIGELGEGCEYYFRVSAENEYGIGEAVETSDPIRASQAPTPPPSIVPTDITKNSVSLAWTRPKHDGGSRITGYVLEAQKKGTDQWAHVTTVKTMDFIVKNLNENEEYIFRVMAVNLSGRSAPRESKPITVKESTMLPEFDLRAVCQKTVIAKAGDDIKVEIPVIGRPRPTVSWQKDGTALKLTQRTNAEMTGATVVLSIGECNRSDSGVYTMTGKNIAGTVSENLIVRVHDVPGPPKGPNVITIQWTKPEYDGGFKITGYTVEKKELPDGRWIRANFTNIMETQFTVSGLTQDASYEFRVFARNAAGSVSMPSDPSDPITCRDDIVEPRIMVDAVFRDVVQLKAGESFKLDADIAGQPTPSMVWTKNGKEVENTLKLEVRFTELTTTLTNKDSVRADGGEFVLTATNVGGFAKHIFKVKVLDRPGPPVGPLKVSDVTADNYQDKHISGLGEAGVRWR
uniref:Titin n=1 Tax=Periophthalmus magnuspinnatus TaxID=409849 RepID=A0A3B4AC12_9GOBI